MRNTIGPIDLVLGMSLLTSIDNAISDPLSSLYFPINLLNSNMGVQARLLVSEVFRPSHSLSYSDLPVWWPGFLGYADTYPEMNSLVYLAKFDPKISMAELEKILTVQKLSLP